MLDGRVQWKRVLSVEVYGLGEQTRGPRGRAEASSFHVEIRPDLDGVVATNSALEILIPTAVIKAAAKIAGKP